MCIVIYATIDPYDYMLLIHNTYMSYLLFCENISALPCSPVFDIFAFLFF